MKDFIKKKLPYAFAFLLGLVLSATVLLLQFGTSLKNQTQIIRDYNIAYEIEEANRAYFSDSSMDVKMHSLTHAIKYLVKSCKEPGAGTCERAAYYDLSFLYVRLGQLYGNVGKRESADQNYNKGFGLVKENNLFEQWKGTEREVKTPDDLKKYVSDNDKKRKS